MGERLTAAVVGGGAGGKLSLRALQRSERFELLAAADLRPEVCDALREQFPGLRTYPSHEAMFADCPTEVVCVSTFPPSHEPVTLAALELGLQGILVEKPLGHTAASGARLLDAIKARRLPMCVPHGLHAQSWSLEILRRIRAGEIGELKLVAVECHGWDIINAGIHWFNFAIALCEGDPLADVLCQCDTSTRTWRDGMQVETLAAVYATTRSGVRLILNSGDHVPISRSGKSFLFRLVGTAGQIEFWGWDPSYRIQNAAHPEPVEYRPDPLPVTGHQLHLERMAAMIDAGQPDYTIPDSSLAALELCEGAYVSHRHRCRVTFPLAEFVPPAPDDWDPGEPYSGVGGGRDGRQLEA